MQYETEEQELEALKKWWQQNGKLVITGVLVGVIAIFGWRYYQDAQRKHQENASSLYALVMQSAETHGDINEQQTRVNQLMAEYDDTPYAALSAMMLAAQQVNAGDLAKAVQQYEWVIKNASQKELQYVARLRQARLLLASQQYDAAFALINIEYPESFAALYEELKGDVHVARGEADLARAAYDKALLLSADMPNDFLKIKRDDLGKVAKGPSA
jgi:predicted negative regulator of RcsB-dependent stress response